MNLWFWALFDQIFKKVKYRHPSRSDKKLESFDSKCFPRPSSSWRGLLGHDLLFVEVVCMDAKVEGATEAEVKRGASSYRCLAAHLTVYARTAGSIVRVREVAQFGSCGSPFCSSQNQGAVGEPIAGLRGFSARPVGKRGVQSGIFEDEQEPLL